MYRVPLGEVRPWARVLNNAPSLEDVADTPPGIVLRTLNSQQSLSDTDSKTGHGAVNTVD